MPTRRERVILELADEFSAPAIRAAAGARLLQQSLDHTTTSANRNSPALTRAERAVEETGSAFRRASPDIDRFSGRLGLLRDIGITVGPALAPIGAVAIPAVLGLSSVLGSAALAAGVAVGAFQGVGDAVKALNKAELEPTAENLQAAREQLAGLSPAAADFVVQIRDLIPALKEIRDSAAEGLFPGLSEGIDDLERRLPLIERISGSIGEALGGLAADGGESLASGRWGPFLRFIEDEAPGAVTALGKTIGSLSHGIAELFMAFDPLSDGVIASLERGARAFDDWAAGLSETQGFASFVQYVRESGPLVADALTSIADAVVQVLKATAPLGQVSLQGITALADAVAMIAGSDLGGPIVAATAALVIYNRTAAIAAGLSARLAASSAAGAAGARGGAVGGPLGAAVAVASVGYGTDALSVIDSFNRSREAADAYSKSYDDLQKNLAASNVGKYAVDLGIDMQRLTDDLALNGKQGEYVADVQNRLSEAGHGVGAMFGGYLGGIIPGYTADADKASDASSDLRDVIGGLKKGGVEGASALHDLAAGGADAADGVDQAAQATMRLSEALANLNGWLDKRAAIRGYRDDVAALAEGIKDGFGRKDVEQLDRTAAAISQVASTIKDKSVRADFLAGARASLADLADKSGPKARNEIQTVIDKLDDLGLTKAPTPQIDVDDQKARAKLAQAGRRLDVLDARRTTAKVDANTSSADSKTKRTQRLLDIIGSSTPQPTVFANTSPAMAALEAIRNYRIPDKTFTVTQRTNARIAEAAGLAAGGSVCRPPSPRNTIPALLTEEAAA